MAVDIKFLIDGADRGQPTNADEFGVTVNENTEINARIISFDNDLLFVGGVYEYLFSKLDTKGFCNLIQVEVQYQCGGVWKRLTNGYIILSECNFLLDKCQVKTKLYDESFSTKINNNKGIPFSMSGALTKNLQAVTPPTPLVGLFFNPTNGSHGGGLITGVSVYDAFKHLVNCMSDNLIDFESNLFYFNTAIYYDSMLVLTNGDAINKRNNAETVISFETLYLALKKKLNLGMAFETQANGRPLLRIELASYFFGTTSLVNLYDQPNIDLTFDKDRLYQAINFGSNPMLEKEACDDGNTPCTFLQTPFRGFRDETFGFTGECNTSKILNVKSDEVVFDTNVIENVFRFANESHKLNPFIVDCQWQDTISEYRANRFDPYSTGQTVYNGNFRNLKVSQNWIDGYPNSLFSFLEQPFDPTTTVFDAQMTDDTQNWELDDTVFTSFSDFNGYYLDFPNEIADPYNLFDGESYVCPYTGIYTFESRVILGSVAITGTKTCFASINHFTFDAAFIEKFDGPQLTDNNAGFMVLTVTATFICNQGDIVRVDVAGKFNLSSTPTAQFILHDLTFLTPPPPVTIFSYFAGDGVPLLPEELEAVNIDDVRAYLYKFDRPLLMQEIEDILDNTSKPIKFGRWDDPLRVIEGYIKTVNVKSIIKQDASIELKSNKILR